MMRYMPLMFSGVSLQLLIRSGIVLDGQQRADCCANEIDENEPATGPHGRRFSIDAGVKKEKIEPDDTVYFQLSTFNPQPLHARSTERNPGKNSRGPRLSGDGRGTQTGGGRFARREDGRRRPADWPSRTDTFRSAIHHQPHPLSAGRQHAENHGGCGRLSRPGRARPW